MTNWFCGIDPRLLQWALGGAASALVLFGFALGMRQGFKMGRRERLGLDVLEDRIGGTTVPAFPDAPARWKCSVCSTGNWLDVDRWNCRTCGAPRLPTPTA
jgi:hypothetical protein